MGISLNKPFPLESLLILYETCKHNDYYNRYAPGYWKLVDWLAPIDLSPLNSYQKINLPKLLHTFQLDELARRLRTDPSKLLQYYIDLYQQGKLK